MPLSYISISGLRVIGLLLILVTLVACGKHEPVAEKSPSEPMTPAPVEPSQPMPEPIMSPPPPASSKPEPIILQPHVIANYPATPLPQTKANEPNEQLEFYHVVVSGSKHLQLPGNKGLLNVWIGNEAFKPAPVSTMNIAESDIIAAGAYALVEANAPDFEVSPVTSKCLLLHPSGVDVKFYLTAKNAGNFIVSATVNLYNTQDCSGPAIPKTANTLSVNVVVNKALIDEQRKQGFIDIFWAKATEFWAALLVLLFGVILFLVRKHLKKWFGYDQSDS